MKLCRVCKENKSLDKFYNKKRGRHGVGTICKACKLDYDRVYNIKIQSKKLKKIYNAIAENVARRNKYRNERYCCDKEYRDKEKAKSLARAKKRPHIRSANCARYRARKLNQEPVLTIKEKQKIMDIYKTRDKLNKNTDVKHHVHHIKPLIDGGLHHPDNLVVLTEEEHIETHKEIRRNK